MVQCAACRQQFSCNADQHAITPCWCSLLLPLPSNALTSAPHCYCPTCLERLLLSNRQSNAFAQPLTGGGFNGNHVLPDSENPP